MQKRLSRILRPYATSSTNRTEQNMGKSYLSPTIYYDAVYLLPATYAKAGSFKHEYYGQEGNIFYANEVMRRLQPYATSITNRTDKTWGNHIFPQPFTMTRYIFCPLPMQRTAAPSTNTTDKSEIYLSPTHSALTSPTYPECYYFH
jgi:hypothetical protein